MTRIRHSRRIPVNAKPRRIKRTIERMRAGKQPKWGDDSEEASLLAEKIHKMYFGREG